MGRIGFSTENKGKVVNFDFPKLKLKNGEKARVILGLEDPVMEYVHTLRKPTIVDGKPVIKQVTNERTNVTSNEFQKDFVGNPICLGDESVIADKGIDPKRCPACALAKEHPDMAEPPKRRFAMHIIRYRTKSGTFAPAVPFSVEILVWAFTDMVFNKIVDFKEEWDDLRKLDFLLGPCTNENFQKFDIAPGSEAAWLKDEDHKKAVAQTFKENQIPDLTIACGRQVQPEWMKQDVEQIKEAWAIARRSEDDKPGSLGSLNDDLNGLLGGDSNDAEESWAPDGSADDLGDLGTLASVASKADPVDGDSFGDLLASSVGIDEGTDDSGDDSEDLLSDVSSDDSEDLLSEVAEAPKKPAKKAPAKKEVAETAPDNFDDLLGL